MREREKRGGEGQEARGGVRRGEKREEKKTKLVFSYHSIRCNLLDLKLLFGNPVLIL